MTKPQSNAPHKHQRVSIHKAAPKDAGAIAALAVQLAGHEGQDTLACEASICKLIEASSEPRCHVIAADTDLGLAAFAIYYPGYDLTSDTYGFHLSDICVDEALRGQGIGRQMMAHIARHAIGEQREWVSLTAIKRNETAQWFYQSLGFSKIDVHFWAAGKEALASIG